MFPPDPNRRQPRVMPLGHPTRFGSYLLQKRIAVGGMSEVYLAAPIQGELPAATLVIKRLLPTALEDATSRGTFATEARLHTAARHPNVVTVFEAGEVDGEPYLAMEYIAGVDAFRLMRRAQTEQRPLPPSLALYIAMELCAALDCVHALADEAGDPLGIVHRDVTPSNVYLSEEGDVKLGDFGIARPIAHQAGAPGSYVLKGKYAYLSPEQVSGEPFDHRADLFSLGVVLAEMLMGQPLFPGAGQLAVLLAIRDCRIEPLHASAARIPRGLMPILERALSKSPEDRFMSAGELSQALAPYQRVPREALRADLAKWVAWARDSTLLARRIEGVLRDSTKMPVARSPVAADQSNEHAAERATVAPKPIVSIVRTQQGRVLSDLSFAKLIELIVTGQLSGSDEVNMNEEGFRALEAIDLLARHLPPSTATTTRLDGPGIPDYAVELPVTSMLEVLSWLLSRRETGVLFADRIDGGRNLRKELYFDHGKLILAASSEASELLGESLVRSGAIDRGELEMALLALPLYDGRLGDTLIGLGLVGPVEVFRAIQNQGRAKVAEIFRWPSGRITFYRGVAPQRVDFRLDLDIPDLMLAGLESTGTSAIERYYADRGEVHLSPIRPPPAHARNVSWPPAVMSLAGIIGLGKPVDDVVRLLQTSRHIERSEALKAIEIAVFGGILERKPPQKG